MTKYTLHTQAVLNLLESRSFFRNLSSDEAIHVRKAGNVIDHLTTYRIAYNRRGLKISFDSRPNGYGNIFHVERVAVSSVNAEKINALINAVNAEKLIVNYNDLTIENLDALVAKLENVVMTIKGAR